MHIQRESNAISVSWKEIGRITIIGKAYYNTSIINRALNENIPIAYLSRMGELRGTLIPQSVISDDIASLQKQKAQDKSFCLAFSKTCVRAKIRNGLVILRRAGAAVESLTPYEQRVEEVSSLESLLGIEGSAARTYFSLFGTLVSPFSFTGRHYRPPDNEMNAMLSLGYTLLYNRITSMLRLNGFDPRIGFYHQSRGQHAALASDLIEEVRHLVDRLVLRLIRKKSITPEHFGISVYNKVSIPRLTGPGFRIFITAFENMMDHTMRYQSDEGMTYNEYLHEMVINLRRCIRLNAEYKALRIT